MLKRFHRVLIISAIVLGLMLAVTAGVRYMNGDASLVPGGIIGGVGAVVLGIYLRWFLKKSSSLRD